MEIKKGKVVVILPLRDIGIVIGELERTGIKSEKDKQWIVKHFNSRLYFLSEDLIPIMDISEIKAGLPFEEIRKAVAPRAIAILMAQVKDLTKKVDEIYNRLQSVIAQ